MQAIANALLNELASRTISFLVSTYGSTATRHQEADDLHRLQLLLLRSGTVVEEAEGRHVTSRGMLRQLGALRDEMFRGCYVLDTVTYDHAAAATGATAREEEEEEEEEGGGVLTFAPSRFNPAKRVRLRFRFRFWSTSGDSDESTAAAVLRPASPGELQQTVRRLEAATADAKELVAFLARCPPQLLNRRQPYSAHLFVDKYMFGRHAEREQVVEFLLQDGEPPAGAESAGPGVRSIVGPRFIGKSTLVEHVCEDERVRGHFSLILFYRGRDLEGETMDSFRRNCVVKHQNNDSAAMDEKRPSLLVIELPGDVDDGTWRRLYCSCGRRLAQGSKVILTSRSEKIARFGTTTTTAAAAAQVIRLRCLSTEAFWYFFKLLVFGSTDPEEHPVMKSMAMEMALETRGSFMTAYVMAAMLRAGFSRQLWRKVLVMARQYIRKNLAVFGEYPDDFRDNDHPWHVGNMEPHQYFRVYRSYQKDSDAQEEGLPVPDPDTTLVDLLSGRARLQRGRFEILHWKSTIPPYFSYVSPCDIYGPETP